MLMIAAKKAITRKWKQKEKPDAEDVKRNMETIRGMEFGNRQLKDREVLSKKWKLWEQVRK